MAAANKNNLRFNLEDDYNIEDNGKLQEGGDGQQEVPPFDIFFSCCFFGFWSTSIYLLP
jgi:hypothetical protein